MKAYYYATETTDLVRPNNTPLIKHFDKGLYSDLEDFMMDCYIRYVGIHAMYPQAVFQNFGFSASVYVDGIEVFRKTVLGMDTTPVEIPDEDEDEL
jgi:hypothetical protein